jgi:hypothetical protein
MNNYAVGFSDAQNHDDPLTKIPSSWARFGAVGFIAYRSGYDEGLYVVSSFSIFTVSVIQVSGCELI